jgi:putative membrane protein
MVDARIHEAKENAMWHSMWAWDGGWAWFGVAQLLWWVLVIGAAVVLFRSMAGGRRANRPPVDRAFEILRERFARGEIDQGEYDQRVQHLKEGRAPPES